MAFKMKGNPFQRNFGIGSPVKKLTHEDYESAEYHYGDGQKDIVTVPKKEEPKKEEPKKEAPQKQKQEKTPEQLAQEKKDKKKAKRKEKLKATGDKLKGAVAEVGKDVAKAALTDAITPKEKQIVNKAGNFGNIQFGRFK